MLESITDLQEVKMFLKSKFKELFLPMTFFLICLFMSLTFEHKILHGIFFALFQIFGLLLPGFAIVQLLGPEIKTNVHCLAYSYFAGFCFNIIEYFLIVPFGFRSYAVIFPIVFALLSFLLLWVKRKTIILRFSRMVRDRNGETICVVFFIITFGIEFFTYAGKNLLPPSIEYNRLYNDCMYWIGNSIELTKEFPVCDFRNYPEPYNYHYFSSLQLALISLVTGIKPIVLGFGYSYLQPVIMLILGGYCLFKELGTHRDAAFGMAILLFTSGLENISRVSYSAHMFIGQFGFDYGMGLLTFYLYILYKINISEKVYLRDCIAMLAVLFVLCGTKGPLAAIGIVPLGILCFSWLFQKNKRKLAFGLGIPALVVFLFAYLFIVNISGYGDISAVFGGKKLYELSETVVALRTAIFSMAGPAFVKEVLFAIVYCVFCQPCIFILMVIAMIQSIRKRKIDAFSVSLVIGIAIGMCLAIYTGIWGGSGMYFAMAAFPMGIAFIMLNKDRLFDLTIGKICCVLLFTVSFAGWVIGYKEISPISCAKTGLKNYLGIENVENRSHPHFVSNSQMDAYYYLHEIAEVDEQIATNRNGYVVGVFTECYVVSTGDTEGLFATDDPIEQEQYIIQLKERGVKYLVYDKPYTPMFRLQCSEDGYKVLYENDSTIIYQLL